MLDPLRCLCAEPGLDPIDDFLPLQVVGIVVVLYVIYNSYLGSLSAAGWTYGISVQAAVLVWLALGVAWLPFLCADRPETVNPVADNLVAHEEYTTPDGEVIRGVLAEPEEAP